MLSELDPKDLKDQLGELSQIAKELGHEELGGRHKALVKRLKLVILNLSEILAESLKKRNAKLKESAETMTPKPN